MSRHRDPLFEPAWRYRLALLAVGLLVLTSIHRTFVHSPAVQRITHLRGQIGAAELATRKRQRGQSRLPKLEDELSQLKREIAERVAAIAHVGDRPILLAQVSQVAQAAGLEIMRFRPREEIRREGYVEVPVQLDLEGEFRDFVTFLSTLAKIPQLSKLGKLMIAAPDALRNLSSRGISLEILTYALPESMEEHRTSHVLDAYSASPVASEVGLSLARTELADSLRDPFQPPGGFPCDNESNSLESYDLSELRLAGIVWDNHAPRGLVIDRANSGHIITPGSRIGNRGGIVDTITPTHIIVRENSLAGTSQPTLLALPVFAFGATAEEQDTTRQEENGKGDGNPTIRPSVCATSP